MIRDDVINPEAGRFRLSALMGDRLLRNPGI